MPLEFILLVAEAIIAAAPLGDYDSGSRGLCNFCTGKFDVSYWQCNL